MRTGYKLDTGVSSTRGDGWFQKVLYAMIAILGVYILYKGGGILLQSQVVRQAVETGGVQKFAEDAAVTTYAPGYAAAVKGKEQTDWIAELMKPLVPVYSYLADVQREKERETKQTDLGEQGGGTASVRKESADDTYNTEGGSQAQTGSTGEGADESQEPEESTGTGADGSQDIKDMEEPGQGAQNKDGRRIEELTEIQEPSGDVNGLQIASDETEGQAVMNESIAAGKTAEDSQNGTEPAVASAAVQTRLVQAPEISGRMLEQASDFETLLTGFYTMDAGTAIDGELLDGEKLLTEDLRIQRNPRVPQILIYHTHSQETFIDSEEGDESTSIVGMGEVLAEFLRTRYGYQVIHDTSVYDLIDGVLDRSKAYDYAREGVEKILADYPTIEVVIDLHRDGVEGHKFVTEIDGKPTSMIMFFNGLSRNEAGEPLTWLANPYLEENLAFSLQLQLRARQQYPDFTRNIYLKAQRYNLHLRPRSLLIEAGTQLNTVEEERNAMEPLADLLAQVLGGVTVLRD